ncbi:hypothetical protein SDRG_07355 [Saprolegnia diclina VS20]|uniref:START domain-containing protein n=1 Tax=Saprolegnia diclina (strain VS20) TaxID=1156394 RepID=T0QK80_SAPDV|nr:hypothetical protein SDRG_07355 [Saprolegnia diclina VS20]EQC35121.1 hypothetical protein SDRG_07355 [Saprolegnia diclina VS20]|eukprot:XP_008611405.1 hypothetical protein SDRG_07355 [Saprolegnia diclina VS20]
MNPGEALAVDVHDPSGCDYSVQWSPEERNILDNLLGDDETDHSESPPPGRNGSKHRLVLQRYRKRKREELLHLRNAANELEARLQQLQAAKAHEDRVRPPTKWRQLAVQERQHEVAARKENQQLRELVHRHMVTAQIFASVLEKTREDTQSLAVFDAPTDKWRSLILVKDTSLRTAAMHQILDREYANFDSAFIEAGLVDVSEDFQKHISKFMPDAAHEFQNVVYRRTGLPLRCVAAGLWNVIRGTTDKLPNMNRHCHTLLDVDTHTSYVSGTLSHPLGTFQRRVLCKLYFNAPDPKAATRCVIVCRSIEDDELSPYSEHSPYSNEVSWHALETNEVGGTDLKFFQKFRPSASTNANLPLNSTWMRTLEQDSRLMRRAVHQYIDEFVETPHEDSLVPSTTTCPVSH